MYALEFSQKKPCRIQFKAFEQSIRPAPLINFVSDMPFSYGGVKRFKVHYRFEMFIIELLIII